MDPVERYYFGDARLHKHGIEHVTDPVRQVLQKFQGTDRTQGLVLPASSNNERTVRVRCFMPPNASSPAKDGLRADIEDMIALLEARSLRADPLVWVKDDSLSKAVTSYAAPTITSAGHGRSNGDIVLVRRLGAGLYSLAVVSNVAANTFDVAAVGGTSLHAIAAADEIHLVEQYWLGAIYARMGSIEPQEGDFWTEGAEYSFACPGGSHYSRTTSAVGS